MLEIIVLGHIPGTNIFVTFTTLIFFAFLGSLYISYKIFSSHLGNYKSSQNRKKLIYYYPLEPTAQ